jgi:dolichyl-phosphate-mannose-protein mannosyltransferase
MAQSVVELDGPLAVPPPRPATGRRRSLPHWLLPVVVVALLGEMAFAMISAAVAQSPGTDEPVYIGTAVVYLEQHSLRYNVEHPPLGKLIMESGLWFAHPRLDPAFSGDEWALGEHVLFHTGNDAARLLLFARLPIIVLTLLFGLVAFAFARDLTGTAGAVAALALYCFSPDLITHGSLATLDVPAAGFLLTTTWLVWRARRRPGRWLPLAGLTLGAAMATRMSVLPVVPVLLALVVWSYRYARRDVWRAVAAAAGVGAIAVAVVWVSYLLVDPHLRWTPSGIPSIGGLRGLVTHLMPLPAPYRDGMRLQFGLEDIQWGGFLFGRQYEGSLWYYLPAAVLVKTPLGMLALWAAGSAVVLSVRRFRPAAPYLLVPATVLFAAAMTGSRDFGTRYVVFLPMILAVAAATVLTLRWRWARPGAVALVVYVAVSSAATYPYYLPYSNEAFGGPSKTYLRLHDSNSDWGQDLARMADRLRTRYGNPEVWLVYKGGGDPAYYGIRFRDPESVPADQVRGLMVLSNDAIDKADPRLAALIATSTPIDQVGHSMTIFRRG